jgi:2-aminoadipate transaminase
VSVSSFSKILAPGLRCGWLECAPDLMATLLDGGCIMSGGTASQFSGCVVAKAIESGAVEENLNELRRVYAAKLGATVAALRRNLPAGCTFTEPGGGYFIWVKLPVGLEAKAVLEQGISIGVKGGMDGARCSPTGEKWRGCIRVCFAALEVADLEEGCARLGSAIRASMPA